MTGLLAIAMLFTVGTDTASAQGKNRSFPSVVRITGATGGQVTGDIESPRGACIKNRAVDLVRNGARIATTRSTQSGQFTFTGVTTNNDDKFVAEVHRIETQKPGKPKRICRAGASPEFTSTGGDPGAGTRQLGVNVLGLGRVDSTPAGINACRSNSGTCTADFPTNSQVTLSATPDQGQSFTGWSGACTGAGTCTLTMSENRAATAQFSSINTRNLAVAVAGLGRVTSAPGGIDCRRDSGTCSAPFTTNDTVTLTANPDQGQTFLGWTGACTGNDTTCSVVMSQDRAATASFSGQPATRNLAVAVAGLGQVDSNPAGIDNCRREHQANGPCSGAFTNGSTVTLSATPDAGQSFVSWGGACAGFAANQNCTVEMNADRVVTATFTDGNTQTLSVSPTGDGRVDSNPAGINNCRQTGGGSCAADFPTNSQVTLTATPDAGRSFQGWGGACAGQQTTCTVTMSQSRHVTASFSTGSPPPSCPVPTTVIEPVRGVLCLVIDLLS